MRVIGGTLKGRKIPQAKGFDLRPTTDFAREGLFNLLHHRLDLEGLHCLDLFTGTGSVSLELISRGAATVTSIDISRAGLEFRENLAEQWNLDNWWNAQMDVFEFLRREKESYDLIFADPPYHMEKAVSLPEKVLSSSVMKEATIFIMEHSEHLSFTHIVGFQEHRRYGKVNFSFFEKA